MTRHVPNPRLRQVVTALTVLALIVFAAWLFVGASAVRTS